MTEAPSLWTSETAHQCARLLEALALDTGERWGDGGLQPWQRDVYAAALGLPGAPSASKQQIWIEGPTGSGKDQLLAAACLAFLRFAPEGSEVVCYSSDYDRCKDVVKSVKGFIQRTDERGEQRGIGRWLGPGIEMLRDEIRSVAPDGTVRVAVHIESLDGYSASGSRADLYLMNEVQSWPDPHGQRVWEESLARYDKLAHGRFVVFSNAPFSPPGDFRRDEREKAAAAGTDSPWWFRGIALEECPWLTEEKLERKRRSLPPHVYRRLYLCLPTDGRGELLLPEIYDAAVDPNWAPPDLAPPGVLYVHGLDIGVSRDHAVHLVLHRDLADGRIYLDRIRVWVPATGAQVDLDGVEQHVEEELRRLPGSIYADPFQAVALLQRLERQGFTVTQVAFTTEHLTQMCEAVRSAFNDRRIVLFPDAGLVQVTDRSTTSLRRQVLEAEVVESEKGSRIRSPRNMGGHGDQLSALSLALFGVTEQGLGSVPACVGSHGEGEPPAVPAPREERRRAWIRPHAGRYLGQEVRRRIVPR